MAAGLFLGTRVIEGGRTLQDGVLKGTASPPSVTQLDVGRVLRRQEAQLFCFGLGTGFLLGLHDEARVSRDRFAGAHGRRCGSR